MIAAKVYRNTLANRRSKGRGTDASELDAGTVRQVVLAAVYRVALFTSLPPLMIVLACLGPALHGQHDDLVVAISFAVVLLLVQIYVQLRRWQVAKYLVRPSRPAPMKQGRRIE